MPRYHAFQTASKGPALWPGNLSFKLVLSTCQECVPGTLQVWHKSALCYSKSLLLAGPVLNKKHKELGQWEKKKKKTYKLKPEVFKLVKYATGKLMGYFTSWGLQIKPGCLSGRDFTQVLKMNAKINMKFFPLQYTWTIFDAALNFLPTVSMCKSGSQSFHRYAWETDFRYVLL